MTKVVWGAFALAACAWGTASAWAEDLEILDPQIAQAFAQALTEVAEKVEKPQVKVDADLEKSCGVHLDQTGLIIVPQKDIKPENDAVNSDPGAPVGHLFMSQNFTPVIDGKAVDPAKIRTITFSGQDGNEHKVNYLILAARHTDDDVWHLYAYGTDSKPLLDARIGEGTGPGTQPIALEVKVLENGEATAYVTFFDQYQCTFKVKHKAE
ncbi:MAG TPA: hypothetical protein VHV08_04165 [Pirellulales bacterium]|nr:hypothetical protein [Pirellulales bacterium]